MRRHASVQGAFLPVEGIRDDFLRLTNGEYRAILEVGSVNLALQGEVEQEATLAGFASFLNGLNFPIQILARALPVDVASYVGAIENRALQLPAHLADLARDHASYIRRLARSRTLLERRFYVVVPAGGDVSSVNWWPFRHHPAASADDADARQQLTFRCDEVARQLGRSGLSARRLKSRELAELLYTCWCAELARLQRLRNDLAEYDALVVRADLSHLARSRRPECHS